MNSMKKIASLAVIALSTALVTGCSGSADDGDTSSTDDAIKSHPSAVVGTWESGDGDTDNLIYYSFTFKSSGSYTAIGGCRPNPTGPHCFAITESSGKWKVQKSGPELGDPAGASEIVLTDSFGQTDTYFYSIDSGVLSLSETYRGEASTFEKQ